MQSAKLRLWRRYSAAFRSVCVSDSLPITANGIGKRSIESNQIKANKFFYIYIFMLNSVKFNSLFQNR